MKIDINIQNKFTKDEKELFSILREVTNKYTPSTDIYLVGGFVRDLLMGKPSNDIDVMLSNISGEDFAKLVTKYMGIKDAHTIKSNPEKSKFITTSSANIPLSSGNIKQVDFAQARSEVYRDNSRIPDIKPATPQEDAYRRDLTINSLMFNLKTNQIEDFTGKGIKDLITMTIRTPEDPLKTFTDDPLRVFRCARFAARYNGNIDPDTYNAMTNPILRDEIKKKVSKERIGIEIKKMLEGENPQIAINLLYNTGLMGDIIEESLKGTKYEGKMSPLNMPQQNVHHKLNVWEHSMMVVKNLLEMHPEMNGEKKIIMIMAAIMHDLGKLFSEVRAESKTHPGSISYHGHEQESSEISSHILRYLKMEPFIDYVSKLAQMHMRPHRFTEQENGGMRALRRFIRQCGEQTIDWIDVLNLSIADALAKDAIIDPNTVQTYQELEKSLQAALISLKPTKPKDYLKPILDGNEIMQILNIKPGKWMAEITEFVKELRDENPDITKEQATQMIKDKFGHLSNQMQNIPQKVKPTKNQLPAPTTLEETNMPREASSKETTMETLCPMDIVNSKINEVNNLLDEKKFYEVFTILNELKEQFGNDENIVRLLAVGIFRLLIRNEKYRYNDLIQHIMDKAESNFFDPTLCCYAVGILLLLETETKEKTIKEVAERMITMAPDLLKKVLSQLPEEIYRPKLKKEIERELGSK